VQPNRRSGVCIQDGTRYSFNVKHFVKSAICLAGALALNANARADDVALSGNPYTMVVERNVFDLVAPPPPDTTPPPSAEPPVKITPNGITDILGQLQVLFKVSGRTPGKENSYILAEGQREDDIEVTKINAKTGLVTFNNHGLVQEIPLANASANSTPAARISVMPVPSSAPGVNPGGAGFGAGTGFDNSFGSRVGNDGGNPGGAGNGSRVNPANQQPAMSPEEQIIMIEAQRQQYQSVGDPIAKILPPTELTPPPDSGDGSTPAAP
jgi:hypothetical protein